MIITAIINTFLAFVDLLLQPLPTLPALAPEIGSAFDAIVSSVSSAVAVLTFVFSAPLIVAIFAVTVGLMTFEYAYVFLMWLIRKIPFVNIK